MCTGHTADDNAENFLLFLLRGTGPFGSKSIFSPTKPIIRLRRMETEAICMHYNFEWVEDLSNKSDRFTRNRVRNELLPLACKISKRDVTPLINQYIYSQQELVDFAESRVSNVDPTDVLALKELSRFEQKILVSNWIMSQTASSYRPDFLSQENICRVIAGEIIGTQLFGGWILKRKNQKLYLLNNSLDSIEEQSQVSEQCKETQNTNQK